MQLQFFKISAQYPQDVQQMLNTFCAGHRVISIDKQFVAMGAECYWSFAQGQDDPCENPGQT